MNAKLAAWNTASEQTAIEALLACCSSTRWARGVVSARPYHRFEDLVETAERIWFVLDEADWLEAFAAHPRIGDRKPAHTASHQSATWSNQEQSSTQIAAEQTLARLAELNAQYEEQFGFTYIVCATGKSAEEMLAILERRLNSTRSEELKEAAEQQRQITHIRLAKWINP